MLYDNLSDFNIILLKRQPKKFTLSDLHQYETLFNITLKEAYPELYGSNLPDSIKYVGDDLFDICDLERNKYGDTQIYRSGGVNKKKPNIRRNISRNGFKLRYPAIAVFRARDGKLYIITGHTRIEILEEDYQFINIIASIYEAKKGYSDEQVMSDVSLCGNIFNTIHDESGQLELGDIFREVNLAIKKGWVKKNYDDIYTRVLSSRGSGLFTDLKLSETAQEIYNTYNPDEIVVPWKNDSKTVSRMKGMGFNKINTRHPYYEDKDGNKYILVSTQTGPKSLDSTHNFAIENDVTNIILHTGILEGSDLKSCYDDRVSNFVKFYSGTLNNFSTLYFKGKKAIKDKVKLYGVLPSLSSVHNLDEVVLFDKNNNMYQKNSIITKKVA